MITGTNTLVVDRCKSSWVSGHITVYLLSRNCVFSFNSQLDRSIYFPAVYSATPAGVYHDRRLAHAAGFNTCFVPATCRAVCLLPCRTMPCHVMPCYAMPCHAMPFLPGCSASFARAWKFDSKAPPRSSCPMYRCPSRVKGAGKEDKGQRTHRKESASPAPGIWSIMM